MTYTQPPLKPSSAQLTHSDPHCLVRNIKISHISPICSKISLANLHLSSFFFLSPPQEVTVVPIRVAIQFLVFHDRMSFACLIPILMFLMTLCSLDLVVA